MRTQLARKRYYPGAGALRYANRTGKELKSLDTDIGITQVVSTTNTNDDIIGVNYLQQGAGQYNRVGRQITMKSLRVKLAAIFTYNEESTSLNLYGNQLRMVVVYDGQPNGVTPTWDTIFGRIDQVGQASTGWLDPVQPRHSGRFRILRDKVIQGYIYSTPSSTGTQENVINQYHLDEYIKLPNLLTQYQSSTNPSTVADISTGTLYVCFRAAISNDDSQWLISSTSLARLRYADC